MKLHDGAVLWLIAWVDRVLGFLQQADTAFTRYSSPYALRARVVPFVHSFQGVDAEPFKVFITSVADFNRIHRRKPDPLLVVPALVKSGYWTAPVYWDIGANTGLSFVQLSRMIERIDGSSAAFECEPTTYLSLQRNIALNRLGRAKCYPLAISHTEDTARFFVNVNKIRVKEDLLAFVASGTGRHSFALDEKRHDERAGYEIVRLSPTFLVEQLGLMAPNWVYIDAYGSESEIVRGFGPLLEREPRPGVFILEIDSNLADEHDPRSSPAAGALLDAGYELYPIRSTPGLHHCYFIDKRIPSETVAFIQQDVASRKHLLK